MLDTIVIVSTILSNATIVIGIVVAIMQLKNMQISNDLLKKSTIADHERRKKQSTIEFTHTVLEERTIAAREINRIFPNDQVINVDDPRYNDNVVLQAAVFKYLSLMERLAVGINIGVYDLHTYIRIIGRRTVDFYKRLEPIIIARRRKLDMPSLYIDFEKLVKDIVKESKPLNLNEKANIEHS
ncbi:MAG: DUF4760 domain-containing protein [Oscillospiraceae bacterium]|nr:DUF4760 domain-containing protein [Oscillospiraceae bacterium]